MRSHSVTAQRPAPFLRIFSIDENYSHTSVHSPNTSKLVEAKTEAWRGGLNSSKRKPFTFVTHFLVTRYINLGVPFSAASESHLRNL